MQFGFIKTISYSTWEAMNKDYQERIDDLKKELKKWKRGQAALKRQRPRKYLFFMYPIKCLFGFHKWEYFEDTQKRRCSRCGKVEPANVKSVKTNLFVREK